MTFAICDDDGKCSERLKKQISAYYGTAREIDFHIFDNGTAFTESIRSARVEFDAIFLDVLMPDSNGVFIAEILRREKILTPIIFVSTSWEYVTEGYYADASAYLIKPVGAAKLKKALDKLMRLRRQEEDKFLVVYIEREPIKIPVSQIITIERDERKTVVKCLDQREIRTTQSISSLRKQIEKHPDLVTYSHADYLNAGNIREYDKKKLTVTMADKGKSKIYVSRAHIKAVLDAYAVSNGNRNEWSRK
jgi:DNA-binding LytR/AlgR family response regulator